MSQERPTPKNELMDPPSTAAPSNHGRTVAGWFLFWAASVAALIGAVGAVLYNMVLIGLAIGVAVLALVISGALRLMGRGQPVPPRTTPSVEDLPDR